MGPVERAMIEEMLRHFEAHGRGMTEAEAMAAIVPSDQPKLKHKPAYKHCYQRLAVRGMFDSEKGENGEWLVRPSEKALTELPAEH